MSVVRLRNLSTDTAFALGGIVPLALQLTGVFYRNGFVVGLIGSASEMPEFTLTFEANTPV